MNDREILLKLRRQWGKDEAVAAINAELKKVQFNYGVLKSDYAELEDKVKQLENLNKSHLGSIKALSKKISVDEQLKRIKELQAENKQQRDRIIELSVKIHSSQNMHIDNALPSKDEAVDKGYSIANSSEYNRRLVLRNTDDDLYYTGWMDCFEWISNDTNKKP